MKIIPAILCLIAFIPAPGYSQRSSVEKTILNTNLFTDFINGSVLMKDGRTEPAFLNYDTENQSIVFKKDDLVMTLTNLASVDTIFMSDLKFVPVGNIIYEVALPSPGIGLYITYTNKKKPVVASPDHGGTERQTADRASNNVAQAYVSRPNQLNFTAQVLTHYWLKRGNSFYKANNENQLLKVFPFKDNTPIKNYISENKIDFDKRDDIARLVVFCNSQMK
jgi:phosphoribosylpyrophosphate synthetase